MRISDWSSDVCSSDLHRLRVHQVGLAHVAVHPCAAALGRACVRVEDEDRQLRTVLVEHVVDGRVRVVLRKVGALLEADPVELVGGEEHRSEEHTSELQSLMRISYAVFCLKKKQK